MTEDNKNASDDYFEYMLNKALEEIADEQGETYMQEMSDIKQPVYSKQFTQNINSLIKKSGSKYKFTQFLKSKKIAVVICLILSGIVITNHVDANKLFYFMNLFRIGEDRANVSIKSKTLNYPINELPDEWDYIYVPNYVPAGYHVDKVSDDYGSYTIVYSNSKTAITFLQTNKVDIKISTDNEKSDLKSLKINSYDAYISTSGTSSTLIWSNDGYTFTLISDISGEELIKMAETIEIFNN